MSQPPTLSGRAALESLYNSAVSVMEQAQNLVQLTKPDTPERGRGIPPAKRKTPAGTHTVAPVLGIEELGRIVDGAWVEWRAATLMACESEPLRKTIGEAITEVIQAGRALVNASVQAERTMDRQWGKCHERLNTATLELQGLMRLVPESAGPVAPAYLLTLARRLADQSDASDYGLQDGTGVVADAVARLRKHSWGDEVRVCRQHDPSWLDSSFIGSATHRDGPQRALVTLFELQVAARMLEDRPEAAGVRTAVGEVSAQPYWKLTPTPSPRNNSKSTRSRPLFPWLVVEKPIPAKPLRELLAACETYAAGVADAQRETEAAGSAAHGAGAVVKYRPASYFKKGASNWLRKASGKQRVTKRVEKKIIAGTTVYLVSDVEMWRPDLLPDNA